MNADRPILITGGAGFLGTNLANRLAANGRRVLIYDNLSRPGVERNLTWLTMKHGERIVPIIEDVRSAAPLAGAVGQAIEIFHFAAQVAVTTSLADPVTDFTVNAGGTLNLLEAIRACPEPPPLVYTSTNKVYGALEDVSLVRERMRYAPAAAAWRDGVDETRPLEFLSPYGCSKGVADQYVLDYARSYSLPAVVFRMSCIYGPHQFGTEDQGWVAHFILRALAGEPITLCGDGFQVRDLLFVDDLVDAFLIAQARMAEVSGRAFNIGGGPAHTTSLLELVELLASIEKRRPAITLAPRRLGDQCYYVTNHGSFSRVTGWRPKVTVADGVTRVRRWLSEMREQPGRPVQAGTPSPLPLAQTWPAPSAAQVQS